MPADIRVVRAAYHTQGLNLATVLAKAPTVGSIAWRVKARSLELAFDVYKPKSGALECTVLNSSSSPGQPLPCTGFRISTGKGGRAFRVFIPSSYFEGAKTVRVGTGSSMINMRGFFNDDGLVTPVHTFSPVQLHLSPPIQRS